MKVHFMCSYYSQWAATNIAPRTQSQWDAFKFCRAVKNRSINGTCTVPLKTGGVTINKDNVGLARGIFGRFIEFTIKKHYDDDFYFIPVPSKDGLVDVNTFRSLEMLNESIGNYYKNIFSYIRFIQVLQPANAGGPRGEDALIPYMISTERLDGKKIILVDDILTTGGTVKATIRTVENFGGQVLAAIVCGYTVSDSIRPVFGAQEIDLTVQDGLF